MEDETQDVQPESSTGEEAVKTEDAETSSQTSATDEETQQSQASPQDVKDGSTEEEVDERKVPWKNRAMEFERKYHSLENKYGEMESRLPQIIEEAIAKNAPSGQAKPKYTKAELIAFKNSTESPEHRTWAETELERLRDEESQKFYETQRAKEKAEERLNRDKQAALGEVMRKYPIMFNPDGTWNNVHPLTQKLAQVYNTQEGFKKSGLGLLNAADSVFADYALQQQPQLAKQQAKLKRQVKKLQKATLMEGSGQSGGKMSGKTPVQAAKERFMETGKEGDLKAYNLEVLKSRGE